MLWDCQRGLDSARKYAAPRHDTRLVATIDEVEQISHRGIDTDPWGIVSTVTSAVMSAFATAETTTVTENAAPEEALDQMEATCEGWFDPSAVHTDQDVAGVGVQTDVVREQY